MSWSVRGVVTPLKTFKIPLNRNPFGTFRKPFGTHLKRSRLSVVCQFNVVLSHCAVKLGKISHNYCKVP